MLEASACACASASGFVSSRDAAAPWPRPPPAPPPPPRTCAQNGARTGAGRWAGVQASRLRATVERARARKGWRARHPMAHVSALLVSPVTSPSQASTHGGCRSCREGAHAGATERKVLASGSMHTTSASSHQPPSRKRIASRKKSDLSTKSSASTGSRRNLSMHRRTSTIASASSSCASAPSRSNAASTCASS